VTGLIRGSFENLYTVLDVQNNEVIRYQRSVIIAENDLAYVYPDGNERALDHIDELAGEVVVSEKAGDKWGHALLAGRPDKGQAKALDRLTSPFEDREHIPAGNHAPGVSWEVDATQIKRLLGSSANAVSGKLTARFLRRDVFEGEDCAVIEYGGTMRVRCEPELNIPERIETSKVVKLNHYSIKSGIVVHSSFEIDSRSSGRMRLGGHVVRFEGNGHSRVTYRAAVEK
jgi:hypothetical protein